MSRLDLMIATCCCSILIICLPAFAAPQKSVSVKIPKSPIAAKSAFEASVQLTVNGKPLNAQAKKKSARLTKKHPAIFPFNSNGSVQQSLTNASTNRSERNRTVRRTLKQGTELTCDSIESALAALL